MSTHKSDSKLDLEDDPLIGSHVTTDSPTEARLTPDDEVVLRREPTGPSEKSKSTAILLAVTLGAFGAHRFYLGFHRVAWFQLLTSLAAIMIVVIWGVVFAMDTLSLVLTAMGVVSLLVIWGFCEGVAILAGIVNNDAELHPLR